MTKVSGTPYYIAPEVLQEVYDEKCDIWSAGVILYVLLCGYPPFNGNDDVEIMKAVKKGKYDFPAEEWDGISKEAKDLISNMLAYNPKQRFSPEQCLKHTWFKKSIIEQTIGNKEIGTKMFKNMKAFKAERKLESAVISYIVNNCVSKEEKTELLKQFTAWDKNSDGVLSKEEIYDGYKTCYGELQAQQMVDEIFAKIDLDKNGYIDYNEFLTASMSKNQIMRKQNLKLAFKSFDKDGSGSISIEEILAMFSQNAQMTDEEKKELEAQLIKDWDKNGDGQLDANEFEEMLVNLFEEK